MKELYIYIYIYIYTRVCVCVYFNNKKLPIPACSSLPCAWSDQDFSKCHSITSLSDRFLDLRSWGLSSGQDITWLTISHLLFTYKPRVRKEAGVRYNYTVQCCSIDGTFKEARLLRHSATHSDHRPHDQLKIHAILRSYMIQTILLLFYLFITKIVLEAQTILT